jgi:hypothetical protein
VLTCTQCYVAADDRGNWWACQKKQKPLGPYFSLDGALRVAICDALSLRHRGNPARVSIVERDGSIRAERCVCEKFPL